MLTRARSAIKPAHLFVLPHTVFMVLFAIGPALYALVISFASFERGHARVLRRPGWTTTSTRLQRHAVPARPPGTSPSSWPSRCRSEPSASSPSRCSCTRARTASGRACAPIYFIPGAIAGPILALLAIFMFDPRISPFGPLLQGLGFTTIGQLTSGDRLPWVFSVMFFFAAAGGWVAIFYGAFNGISREITEAAIVDGCGPVRMAWSVKLPLVRPYVIYMLILTFAANVQLFVEPQLLAVAPGSTVGKYWSLNQLELRLRLRALRLRERRGHLAADARRRPAGRHPHHRPHRLLPPRCRRTLAAAAPPGCRPEVRHEQHGRARIAADAAPCPRSGDRPGSSCSCCWPSSSGCRSSGWPSRRASSRTSS